MGERGDMLPENVVRKRQRLEPPGPTIPTARNTLGFPGVGANKGALYSLLLECVWIHVLAPPSVLLN